MRSAIVPVLSVLSVAALAACQPVFDEREALHTPTELKIIGGRNCPHCGRIESKREVVPAAPDPVAPRVYEYILRMPDGSTSMFQETLPATWRVGERVGVM